jgi:hypothetical protein
LTRGEISKHFLYVVMGDLGEILSSFITEEAEYVTAGGI